MDPLRVLQSDEAVIRKKHAHTTSHLHPEPVTNGGFVLHCKLDPVPNHSAHCHIEKCRRVHSPLCCLYGCSEVWAMESVLVSDYLLAQPDYASRHYIFGPAPYSASACSSHPWFKLLYDFLISRNTRKRGSWSTLANS